jgi:hypothetical protein
MALLKVKEVKDFESIGNKRINVSIVGSERININNVGNKRVNVGTYIINKEGGNGYEKNKKDDEEKIDGDYIYSDWKDLNFLMKLKMSALIT